MIKTLYRFLSPRFQSVFLDYKVVFKPRFEPQKKNPHPQLFEIINANREDYKLHLKAFLEYTNVFHAIKSSDAATQENLPAWNNGFLPGLDIIALYSFIRHFKPTTYLEVGSGNSTKVVRKAIVDGQLNTQITSIDPFPRATIDHLADKVVRQPVENLSDYSDFDQLKKGDLLFIDNSHRCLPNSDVTVCFLEILPQLKPGVIVQVHDIYIPYDYPQFMCDRAYSEQYVLAALLLANPTKYQPILPNFFISEDRELSQVLQPVWEHPNLANVERHGGSFWFEIMAG